MRKINIFLASSIAELRSERNEIDVFLRKFSDELEDKYDIILHPVRCENIDPAYTLERKQEEYNQCLRGCDLAYFIFLSRVGKYTREEIEVAKKQFEKTGRPKCFVYVIEQEVHEENLSLVLKEVEQDYLVSYKKCQDMEMLKRQMKKGICRFLVKECKN